MMNNEHVVVGGDNGQLRVFDLAAAAGDSASRSLIGHTELINWIVYCDEQKLIITESFDCTARMWRAYTDKCVRVLDVFSYCAVVHGNM
jgi:WD40 repeat protein